MGFNSSFKGLIPPVTQCVNCVTPDTVFQVLLELTLRSLIRFTVTYVVKYPEGIKTFLLLI